MTEEERENRQEELFTIKAIMKDHNKMSSIIANRIKQMKQITAKLNTNPEDNLISDDHLDEEPEEDENAFINELCKQRDMFIVSDVLKCIFKDDTVLNSMSLI